MPLPAVSRAAAAGISLGCMAAVFIFDNGGDLNLFSSLEAAAGWLEAVDVEADEYAAAFLHDGTLVKMGTSRERVVLTPTDTRDAQRLHQLLEEYQTRDGTLRHGGDALDYANEWLRVEWEQRWPKRPGWLARRVHGDQLAQVCEDLR